MSTEDEQLSSIYTQTPQDVPPAHIDDAILAAARRETASRPRPAYGPFSNNWRVPASLAAVLVLSVGLVNLMDDGGLPTNAYAPFPMEEAEMPSMEMADGIVMKEDRRVAAKARRKPAMKSFSEQEERDDRQLQITESKSALALREPATPMPAIRGPSVSAMADEKISTKKKQSTAKAENIATLASSPAPVPTVDAITTLRLAGKLVQANQAADAFILHYFGEDLDSVNLKQVTLTVADLKKCILELRQLGREKQADKLLQLIE